MDDAEFHAILASGGDARLAKLEPLMAGTLETAERVAEQMDWSVYEGSVHWAELASLSSDAERESLTRCIWLAKYGLYASLDHLRTMLVLRNLAGGVLAPLVVARAALEAASHACWLLDEELDGARRVRRSLAYRFDSATWQRKLDVVLSDPDNEKETPDAVQAEAEAYGVSVVEKNRRTTFDGEAYVGVTAVARAFVESSTDPTLATIYGVLSAVAHARPTGALLLHSTDTADLYVDPLTPPPVHLLLPIEGAIHVCLAATSRTMNRVVDHLGAPPDAWDDWHDQLVEGLRSL